MSIKLWVDDLRVAPEGWHWAKTVTEAIRILDEQDVSEVAVDHDICHENKMLAGEQEFYSTSACPETFEPVARFIAMMWKEGEAFPDFVTIHTANPIGAQKMKEILSQCSTGIVVTVKLAEQVEWPEE